MRYIADGTPTVIFGGEEYGTGSSRDWAAKGTQLLGVKAVIARSFERIHRSNLVGMGVLPLQFLGSDSAASLGITGDEEISISRPGRHPSAAGADARNQAKRRNASRQIKVKSRIDTADRGRLLQARRHPALRAARADLKGRPGEGESCVAPGCFVFLPPSAFRPG